LADFQNLYQPILRLIQLKLKLKIALAHLYNQNPVARRRDKSATSRLPNQQSATGNQEFPEQVSVFCG